MAHAQVALASAHALDDKDCWHRLGVEALRQGNHQVGPSLGPSLPSAPVGVTSALFPPPRLNLSLARQRAVVRTTSIQRSPFIPFHPARPLARREYLNTLPPARPPTCPPAANH